MARIPITRARFQTARHESSSPPALRRIAAVRLTKFTKRGRQQARRIHFPDTRDEVEYWFSTAAHGGDMRHYLYAEGQFREFAGDEVAALPEIY